MLFLWKDTPNHARVDSQGDCCEEYGATAAFIDSVCDQIPEVAKNQYASTHVNGGPHHEPDSSAANQSDSAGRSKAPSCS